jgi:hypothetical protein
VNPERAPVYVLRARGQNLIAESLAELAELIECAHDNQDKVELLLAYYPSGRRLALADLEDLVAALNWHG